MATPPLCPYFSLLFLLSFLFLSAQAKVPASQTFTVVNQGELGPYVTEYDASYRALPSFFASPFQLCFYNTTPDAYYLALRMGTRRSESLFRWVWEANRGRPVRENATFSLVSDGNLVLSDADHSVVWSTETANKGVVGLKLLSTGNIVLYDARGRFVWQSFDHPTDTLLVGQSLRAAGGPAKLVSRASAVDGSFGIYSLVVGYGGLLMYINNVTAQSPLLPYFNVLSVSRTEVIQSVKLEYEPGDGYSSYVKLITSTTDSTSESILARPKYNATLSLLRLQTDGNLVVYTYYDPVDYQAWEETFAFFSGSTECGLPSKCGALGVCENGMCVACPTLNGLLGWSESCQPPKLQGTCGGGRNAAAAAAVDYYKVVGVENFLINNVVGEAGVKVENCKKKCTADCGCKGLMYNEEDSTCWLAPLLGTLSKVSDSGHVAYIKYSK